MKRARLTAAQIARERRDPQQTRIRAARKPVIGAEQHGADHCKVPERLAKQSDDQRLPGETRSIRTQALRRCMGAR
jgi:hypothetical protein